MNAAVKPHPLRAMLIDAIADFLTTEEGRKSIEIEMGKPDAEVWAKMRNYAGVRGWGATKEDAIACLENVLK